MHHPVPIVVPRTPLFFVLQISRDGKLAMGGESIMLNRVGVEVCLELGEDRRIREAGQSVLMLRQHLYSIQRQLG